MAKKILVIDDEELLTKTFSRLLERQGYEVYVAKRGQDALEMIEEEVFDLVVCDIRMPGIDGVETVARLNESFRKKEKTLLPVIFITGYADKPVESRAKQLLPVAYVEKPFDNDELLAKIKQTIGV